MSRTRLTNAGCKPPIRPFPFSTLCNLLLPDRSAQEVARRLGITQRQVVRYRAQKALSADQADVLAFRAGFHPCEVWGDAWWNNCEAAS